MYSVQFSNFCIYSDLIKWIRLTTEASPGELQRVLSVIVKRFGLSCEYITVRDELKSVQKQKDFFEY